MKTTLMNTPEMDKARRAVKALLELSASLAFVGPGAAGADDNIRSSAEAVELLDWNETGVAASFWRGAGQDSQYEEAEGESDEQIAYALREMADAIAALFDEV